MTPTNQIQQKTQVASGRHRIRSVQCKMKDQLRGKVHGFLFILVLTAYAPLGSAETDFQCMQVHDDLTAVLSEKYKSSDKKGLYKRRKLLNKLVEHTTPSCAETLKKRLENKQSGTLAELFHYKLAAPTRKELLGVLEKRSRSHASVIEGEIKLGITPDQVKSTAQRAQRILANTRETNDNWRSLERLQCIVNGLEENPERFDAAYFPVAPAGKNSLFNDNSWTCYKKPHDETREPSCRQGKSVIRHCRKSFSDVIVNAANAGASDSELLGLMMRQEDEINRGLAYFRNMRKVAKELGRIKENQNAFMCPSAAKYLLPRMSSSSKDRIYNCYPDP